MSDVKITFHDNSVHIIPETNLLNFRKQFQHRIKTIEYPDEVKSTQATVSVEQENLNKMIAAGDKEMGKSKWAKAKEFYSAALTIAPGNAYVLGQLEVIESKLLDESNKAKSKQVDADYKLAVGQANIELKAKNYEVAKALFTKAAELKPTEKEPKTQLEKLVKLMQAA